MRPPDFITHTEKMSVVTKGLGLLDRVRGGASRVVVYALAAGVTAGTLGGRMLLSDMVGDRPLLLVFLLPIILSAYIGGLGPGLLATAIAGVGADFFLIQPTGSFIFGRPFDLFQWLIMVVLGILVSVLIESLHQVRRGETTSEHALKSRSAELKVRSGFAFALTCLAVIGVMSYMSVSRLREDAAVLRRADEAIGCLHNIISTVTDAETAQRGYAITGKDDYLEPYRLAQVAVEGELQTLRQLSQQGDKTGTLVVLINQRMDFLAHEIDVRRVGGFAAAQALTMTGEGKRLHDRVRLEVSRMINDERAMMADREVGAESASAMARAVIVAGGVLAFGVVAVALFTIRQDFAGSRRQGRALQEARDLLQERVQERTAELQKRNAELGESERRYRGLAELSPHAIFINRDDRIVFVNEAGVRFFRAKGTEEILGRSPLEFFHKENHKVVRRWIARLMERPQSVPLIEEKMVVADGTEVEAEVAAASFEDAGRLVIQVVCQDITARKQAELAAARMAAIVESSDDAIIGKTMDGIVTSWNRGAELVFGYTEGEMLGQPIMRLIPEDRRQEEKRIMERIGEGENVRHFETVRLRKDGTRIDVSVTISAIKDLTGRVVGASKVARDITERKKGEFVLLNERNFSEALIASLPGILYLYDRSGNFLRWNKNFEALSGYTGAEIAALNPLDFFSVEDRQRVGERIEEVFAQGQAEIEADFVSKDGRRTPCYFTGRQIMLDGKVCLVGVGIDITARRQSESEVRMLAERLTHATDAAGIGVWDWDIARNSWYVTPMYFTMLGYDDGKGFDPRESWRDRLHPEDRLEVDAKLSAVMAGEAAGYSYEARMALADGSYNWFQVISRVLSVDAAGRPSRMIGVRMDISESKRNESEIRELNAGLERRVAERTAQLEAANKELEAFSYSVSHDLRAPLRTVDGYSQAVLEDYGASLPEEGHRYLNTIRRGAQQMGALIDDLLRLARLSRATLQIETVDMNRLVSIALSDLHFRSGDERVELRLRDLPPCEGDPALLRQVWVNLLSNAFKYSGRREKALVEVGALREDGRAVYFVRDNGAGFDMRYAGKLFGVFQRLHRAEDYEGTGVGLAIGQRVVHRHGGRIWAEAKEGEGAIFYFTIGEGIPS